MYIICVDVNLMEAAAVDLADQAVVAAVTTASIRTGVLK